MTHIAILSIFVLSYTAFLRHTAYAGIGRGSVRGGPERVTTAKIEKIGG